MFIPHIIEVEKRRLKNYTYIYTKTYVKTAAIFKRQRNSIKKLTKLNIIAFSPAYDVGQNNRFKSPIDGFYFKMALFDYISHVFRQTTL